MCWNRTKSRKITVDFVWTAGRKKHSCTWSWQYGSGAKQGQLVWTRPCHTGILKEELTQFSTILIPTRWRHRCLVYATCILTRCVGAIEEKLEITKWANNTDYYKPSCIRWRRAVEGAETTRLHLRGCVNPGLSVQLGLDGSQRQNF